MSHSTKHVFQRPMKLSSRPRVALLNLKKAHQNMEHFPETIADIAEYDKQL